MIIHTQAPQVRAGKFHIKAQVSGRLERIGQYHNTIVAAVAEATRLMHAQALSYVQIVNASNGWHMMVRAPALRVTRAKAIRHPRYL